ncbi:hypothetical protein ACWGK7_10995 [Sphingomonas aurantiaca]|jgi:hypothetical protein|uniref:Uncharacterized protein n=1 Tax=Sphingomonas aurantiaca TaxID=185949 RepID=A0A2T5GJ25_9SPHN|nr:hypothetical protein [Sphingomonas aurantiaca]PTQ59317.1 hypothetical protein C8J26_3059 [Sphingomonas aurantiaca]
MFSASPLVPDQIVDCVSTGRLPTTADLDSVAARMWREGAADRSAFSWGQLSPTATDRIVALRSAVLALQGSGMR